MNVVLDTSAVIELLLNKKHAPKIAEIIGNASRISTSDLFRIELTNVWKYVRAGLLEKQVALELQIAGVQLIDHFVKMEEYETEALSEAIRLNHSCYDMLFLCLARRTGSILVSFDKKLVQICEQEGISSVTFAE